MPHSRLESLLQQAIGLSMPTIGRSMVDRPLKQRMLQTGIDTIDDYVQLIESDPVEFQELIEALVVPETWFFRDSEAFAALANWAVQEWFPHHPGETLRILSMPCSTGEEAYSVAICLLNAGLGPLQFRVDANDISHQNLAVAAAGLYKPYSFRGPRQEFLQRFFQETPDGLTVDTRVRASVKFRFGNILDSLTQFSPGEFNVVFCRNLLIYFNPPTQSRALGYIDRILAGDGVLFVGSAEAFIVRSFGFESLGHPMSFGFQKRKRALEYSPQPRSAAALETSRRRTAASVRRTAAAADWASRKLESRKSVAPLPAPAGPGAQTPDELTTASELADRGEFGLARTLCEAAISGSSASADWYLLLGLIEDAENHPEKAADYYRKVLYLEPHNADALAHMALISEQLGDPANAARFRARARRPVPQNAPGETE